MNGFKAVPDTMNIVSEEIKQVVSVLSAQMNSLEKYTSRAGQHSSNAKRKLVNAKSDLLDEKKVCSQLADALQSISREYAMAERKIIVNSQENVAMGGYAFQADNRLSFSDKELWGMAIAFVNAGTVCSPLGFGWKGAIVNGLINMALATELADGTSLTIVEKMKKTYEDISGMTFGGGVSGEVWDKKFLVRDKKNENNQGGFSKEGAWEYDGESWEKAEKNTTEKNMTGKVLSNVTLYESNYSLYDNAETATIYSASDGSSISVNKAQVYMGHKLTTGGYEAVIGAEYSLLSLTLAEQQLLGNDMVGLHGSGKIKAGTISAQGAFKAGWLDENGKFDPNLSAKLSAEAVLVKAEAEVGVDLLGADVNVKGSIGIGAGAHVDVGINDGKLTIDAGAYIGIGGDVSLEIDVSGMVEAAEDIVSFAGDVASVIGDVAEVSGDFIGDVGEAAGGFISGVGNALGDGIKILFS